MNNISQTPADTSRPSVGLGYVTIPKPTLMSRDKYIYDCYKNGWISIYVEGEGIRERVNCDTSVFNWIYFPETYDKSGTPVIWVNDSMKGIMYIVSSVAGGSNYEASSENAFRFIRRFKENFVELYANAQDKILNIVVHSDESSELTINVTDKKKKSKLNVFVNGEIKLSANKNINIMSHDAINLMSEDETNEDYRSKFSVNNKSINSNAFSSANNFWERFFIKVGSLGQSSRKKNSIIDVVPEKISLRSDIVEINKGTEKMVLGDSLVLFLEELIIELSKSEVATPMGLMPLYNKRKIASFTLKLRKLLSKHGFLS